VKAIDGARTALLIAAGASAIAALWPGQGMVKAPATVALAACLLAREGLGITRKQFFNPYD
jgi:hypothetical protein